jgi:hypothetical protein
MVQCQTSKFVKNAAATCPLCGTEDEDLCPLILVCTKLIEYVNGTSRK